MILRNKTTTRGLLIVFTFMFTFEASAEAASVYAIPKHDWGERLNVYDVLEGPHEGQLEYRATYNLGYDHPTDACIDTRSNILFITFESQDVLELVNARTFLNEGAALAAGASDLAGVLIHQVDPNTTLLYTVDRGTNKLFMYDWDADEKELTPLPYSPSQDWYTLLPQDPASDPCVFACGLALDEADGTIYVSQLERVQQGEIVTFTYSNIVYAYDPNVSAPDPNDRFLFTRKIDLGEYEGKDNYAVDIDVDSANGCHKRIEVYAGQSRGNFV